MKRKEFNAEQILAVLKEAAAGVPVAEVIRGAGISEQTFERWKKRYVGFMTDQAVQIKQLENNRLKRLAADLMLDKKILQHVLARILQAGQRNGDRDDTRRPLRRRLRKPAGHNSAIDRERLLIH